MERPTGFDIVQRPRHYNAHPSGVECIEIIEHMTLNLGNATKYLWRGGLKVDDATQDYEKALWYIQRELERKPFLPFSQRDVDYFRSAMTQDDRGRRVLAQPSPWCEPIRCSIAGLIDAHCTVNIAESTRLISRAKAYVTEAVIDEGCRGRGQEP